MTSAVGVFVVYACVILDGLANGVAILDPFSWEIDNFGFAGEKGGYKCVVLIEDPVNPYILGGDLEEYFKFEDFVKSYNHDKGCFECGGKCDTFEQYLKCTERRRFEKEEHVCQHLANDFNREGRCEGGEYRCYRTSVHETLNPRWKPICVCGPMSTGRDDCKSVIKEEEKLCDVKISGQDKTCLCRIKTKLIL